MEFPPEHSERSSCKPEIPSRGENIKRFVLLTGKKLGRAELLT